MVLQIAKPESRSRQNHRHARAVEEMRVALCSGQDARSFTVRLAELTTGSPGNQAICAVRVLHLFLKLGKAFRRQSEMCPQGDKVPASRRLNQHDVEDQAGNQRLGLFIPVRIT